MPEELHRDIAVVVAPSEIHGVGLFAAQGIKANQIVPLWIEGDYRFIKRGNVKEGTLLHRMCKRFCVESKDGYHCPRRFSSMSIGWLLNHSLQPNLAHSSAGYRATRPIRQGEELTIDYTKLDEDMPNIDTSYC